MRKSDEAVYRGPRRVLIVEDSARDAQLMIASLKRAGYSVTFECAITKKDFQQRLLQQDFDIVLSDHNLPSWTGSDALKILMETGKADQSMGQHP